MPIYPGRRKGTHRVTVFAHGRQHEAIVEGTRRDAKRYELDMRAELRARNRATSRREPTFYEFSRDTYTPHAKLHLGASTWTKDRVYQVASLCEHFGSARLSKACERVESYKAAKLAGGMKPSTVNLHLTVLRAMLRWAWSQKLLDEPPKFSLLPKQTTRRVRAWTRTEIRRLYSASSDRLRPMLHFMLDTGLRKGEVIAARWDWIDWDASMLHVQPSAEWEPKTRRVRDVPLSSPLLETLRRLPRTASRIFPRPDGEPYTEFPKGLWERMVAAAGVSGGPHTTRHTYASHFLAAVPDMGLLATVLGHSQLRVTELYAHMLPERLARARDAVQLAPPGKDWAKKSGGTLAEARRRGKIPRKTG